MLATLALFSNLPCRVACRILPEWTSLDEEARALTDKVAPLLDMEESIGSRPAATGQNHDEL